MASLQYCPAALSFGFAVAPLVAILAGCGGAQPREEPHDTAREASASAPASPPAPEVALDPGRVTLDWRAREMEIRATLTKPAGVTPPDTVWVWAYFVNPSVSSGGSWSDAPIAVARPFARADTARVVARGPFHWATTPDLPRSGYFARVGASAASAAAAQVPSGARRYGTSGAVCVASKR